MNKNTGVTLQSLADMRSDYEKKIHEIDQQLVDLMEEGEVIISKTGKQYRCQQKLEIRYIGRVIVNTEEIGETSWL